MRRIAFLTMLWLSLFSLAARGDQVTLKNGDRLSGAIVKLDEDAKTLQIKTDLAGDVTIKWDDITGIVSSQNLHITLSDGRVVVGTVSTEDGKLEIATREAGTFSAPHEAVKTPCLPASLECGSPGTAVVTMSDPHCKKGGTRG